MDVWEVPQSSCPGLDRGFLMDVGPLRALDFYLVTSGDQTDARNGCSAEVTIDPLLGNRPRARRPIPLPTPPPLAGVLPPSASGRWGPRGTAGRRHRWASTPRSGGPP